MKPVIRWRWVENVKAWLWSNEERGMGICSVPNERAIHATVTGTVPDGWVRIVG